MESDKEKSYLIIILNSFFLYIIQNSGIFFMFFDRMDISCNCMDIISTQTFLYIPL